MLDAQTGIERRQAPRVRVNTPVFLRVGDEAWLETESTVANAINLSIGGIYVTDCDLAKVGDRFECNLAGFQKPLFFDCRVAWVSPKEQDGLPVGMGLEFIDLSEPRSVFLHQIVERLLCKSVETGITAIPIDPDCESGTWARNILLNEPVAKKQTNFDEKANNWLLIGLSIGFVLVSAVAAFLLWMS